MNVFLDRNVLIDVLANREPFYQHSVRLWSLAEKGEIEALVSVISFNNIYYIVRKLRNRRTADRALTLLRDVFTPVALDAQLLNQAIDGGFSDFEDAIQYFSAARARVACLVSHNPDDFPAGGPAVLTPAEFLATHSFE